MAAADAIVRGDHRDVLRYTDDARMAIGVAETRTDRGEVMCEGEDGRPLARAVFPGGRRLGRYQGAD
ncbi:hypothetical protein OJF2_78610 (plasmid) [Aquisphaera giovannonii]|uniref:Uncharacterized protein n=1 Tax=Aquisphaera giovannonii TaxID=406548 RepID=A0A5B9WF26_9BACT|nr:hypothetical protein [Aquisphaera giovannonii]QEH39246.1 hypothetical protein OJF2_78610 [Aquisphaera giovannonii]